MLSRYLHRDATAATAANCICGEFRLDRKTDALRGGGSGVPAIVPGKSAESLLIRYVAGLDAKP